jgi:predicted HTH transcriptional regulator
LRNGQFTNACLVLFAEEPRAWAPNLGIRIVSFAGDRLGDIANEAAIDGPAVPALREAVGRLQEEKVSQRDSRSDVSSETIAQPILRSPFVRLW